jgi:hypothetical protein
VSEFITNPYSGQGIMLSPEEVAVYDTLKGCEIFGDYDGLRKVFATVSDSFGATDQYVVVANFNPTVAEVLTVMDKVCPAGWFVINDSQTPNWISVPTTISCS